MSVEKDKLFNIIRQKMLSNLSFTDEIADALDISYDAAYRRLNGKTALSFEEGVKLAKYYKISLNDVYGLDEEETISVLKQVSNQELINFFKIVTKSVSLFAKFKNPKYLFAAKDLPLYYLPENSLYKKFRIYSFLNIHSNNRTKKSALLFKDFKLSAEMNKEANNFRESFGSVRGVEIWNDTTINSSLYQIYYFYEIKMITKEEAVQLCRELKALILRIEQQATKEAWENESGLKYELYYNKLINLNNTLFYKSKKMRTLLIPYTSISYIRIDDEKTCDEIETHFEKKLQFSKKISGDAEVERKVFFTSMYEKIDQLCNQIELKSAISFM